MKKNLLIVLLMLCGIVLLQSQVIDRPAATVNLTKPEFISVKQLEQQMAEFDKLRQQGITGIPTDPLKILDTMIQELLLKQAAEQSKVIATDSEVSSEIGVTKQRLDASLSAQQGGAALSEAQFREVVVRETGLSWEGYVESIREQIVIRKYIQKEKQTLIENVKQPSETEIADQYRINATSFTNPELIRFSEIFIDTVNLSSAEKQKAKERAESIYRDYENGEGTFSELVLKHSDDTKARYNEGDKGFFARNDPRIQTYGSSFFNKIFALDIGSVSKVLESGIGYHIIKITDHRDPKILKLDDPINPNETMTVSQYIQTLLMQEKNARVFQLALQELVTELKEKAEIRIFEDNIK